MYVGNFRWGVLCALGTALLFALWVVLSPAMMKDWVLDPLTGLVCIVTIVAACSQVANAAYDRRSNRIWQAVVSILLLIIIVQFFDVLSDTLGEFAGTDDSDDVLILIIGPLMLATTDRSNPSLRRARAAVWTGFAVQVVSACFDLSGADAGTGNAAATWSLLTDFTEFVSVSFYLTAISLIVIDTSRSIGGSAASAKTTPDPTHRPSTSISGHSYPPPFIFGWSLPPADTAAGRIHRLYNQLLWPAGDMGASARNLWLIGTWPFVAIGRALMETRKRGLEIAAGHGKSTKQQFFEQLGLALWHRINPGCYYTNELYRITRQRDAGHYLLRWETNEVAYSLLYPDSVNDRSASVLGDRAAFARHCQRHNLRHIPVLAVFEDGVCVEGTEALPPHSLFFKPVGGEAGGGERWRYVGNHRYLGDDDISMSAAQLLEYFKLMSRSIPYLMQSLQHNHILVSSISAPLASIRIFTVRTQSGGFEVANALFCTQVAPRPPVAGSQLGDIAASIEIRTGKLGPATDLGGEGIALWHQAHPLTGGPIEGCQLPMWQAAKDLALQAHRTFDDQAFVGWDVALLPEGPALVGGTQWPDIDIIQQASRTALGKTRFGDLLADNLERLLRRCVHPGNSRLKLIKSDE